MNGPTIPLLILGGGYTGRIIYRQASLLKRPLLVSSRDPEKHLAGIPGEERIFFDLLQEKSWSLLPETADVIWTFPATPVDQVRKFGKQKGTIFRRLIVLGSTSAYPALPQFSEDLIDENMAPDKTIPRVAGEESLREEHGAIVLRAAGIYGPGRNPLDWVRQGRIGYISRLVNFIHVEDLAGISLLAIEKGEPGETYTVSDGTPRPWSEIIDVAEKRWGLSRPAPRTETSPGKKISNQKTVKKLLYQFRFPDLYVALDQLEHNKTA